MNYKYVKNPVAVEAFQMTLERRWDNSDWPPWLNEAWQMDAGSVGAVWVDPYDPTGTSLICGTQESLMGIDFGDYIIQGVDGLSVCKPDIFDAAYTSLEVS